MVLDMLAPFVGLRVDVPRTSARVGPQEPHMDMGYLVLAGGLGLLLCFQLGVLVMALLAASDPDTPPEPVPAPPTVRHVAWPQGGAPSVATIEDQSEQKAPTET